MGALTSRDCFLRIRCCCCYFDLNWPCECLYACCCCCCPSNGSNNGVGSTDLPRIQLSALTSMTSKPAFIAPDSSSFSSSSSPCSGHPPLDQLIETTTSVGSSSPAVANPNSSGSCASSTSMLEFGDTNVFNTIFAHTTDDANLIAPTPISVYQYQKRRSRSTLALTALSHHRVASPSSPSLSSVSAGASSSPVLTSSSSRLPLSSSSCASLTSTLSSSSCPTFSTSSFPVLSSVSSKLISAQSTSLHFSSQFSSHSAAAVHPRLSPFSHSYSPPSSASSSLNALSSSSLNLLAYSSSSTSSISCASTSSVISSSLPLSSPFSPSSLSSSTSPVFLFSTSADSSSSSCHEDAHDSLYGCHRPSPSARKISVTQFIRTLPSVSSNATGETAMDTPSEASTLHHAIDASATASSMNVPHHHSLNTETPSPTRTSRESSVHSFATESPSSSHVLLHTTTDSATITIHSEFYPPPLPNDNHLTAASSNNSSSTPMRPSVIASSPFSSLSGSPYSVLSYSYTTSSSSSSNDVSSSATESESSSSETYCPAVVFFPRPSSSSSFSSCSSLSPSPPSTFSRSTFLPPLSLSSSPSSSLPWSSSLNDTSSGNHHRTRSTSFVSAYSGARATSASASGFSNPLSSSSSIIAHALSSHHGDRRSPAHRLPLLITSTQDCFNGSFRTFTQSEIDCLCRAVSSSTVLHELILRFGANGAMTIATILSEDSNLTYLDLRQNAIGINGLMALLDAMRNNKTLIYFALSPPQDDSLTVYTVGTPSPNACDSPPSDCRQPASEEEEALATLKAIEQIVERNRIHWREWLQICLLMGAYDAHRCISSKAPTFAMLAPVVSVLLQWLGVVCVGERCLHLVSNTTFTSSSPFAPSNETGLQHPSLLPSSSLTSSSISSSSSLSSSASTSTSSSASTFSSSLSSSVKSAFSAPHKCCSISLEKFMDSKFFQKHISRYNNFRIKRA